MPIDTSTGPRTQEDRKAITRRKLLNAAVEIVARDGVAAARIEEICARAGYTTGALYRHFGSKAGLIEALCAEAKDRLQAAWSVAGASLDSVIDTAPEQIAELVSKDPSTALFPIEVTLHAARDAHLADFWKAQFEGYFNEGEEWLIRTAADRLALPPREFLIVAAALSWGLTLLTQAIGEDEVGLNVWRAAFALLTSNAEAHG